MSKKKIFITIIIVLLVGFGIYQGFFKQKEPNFTLAEVIRGNIVQEVSETGQIKKGDAVSLSFKNAGEIKEINIEVGQDVKKGDVLAKLDTSALEIQLQGANAALDLAKLDLERLLAGARPEEIEIAETQVEKAKSNLNIAEENLKNSYDKAIPALDASYPSIYNTLDFVKYFAEKYVNIYDEDGKKIIQIRDEIDAEDKKTKESLSKAKSSLNPEDIEGAISMFKSSLETILNNLETVRDIINDSIIYQNKVSAADRSSLDNFKSVTNSALTNIITIQQTIITMKSNLSIAQTGLKEAETNLELTKASPRDIDIELYKAKIEQAQAQADLFKNQINDCTLRSPIDGKIIDIKKKVGEKAVVSEPVISLLPNDPFRVEVDIPEVDIGKVKLGNSCKINLDAFPDKEFSGKVVEIDPSETLISGVIYYKTKISLLGLDDFEEKIKPGMTANVTIITDSRENVLMVPQRAVIEKDGKTIVRVPINNNTTYKEVEVKTGLKGSDGEIEIISGIEEGEKIITLIKNP